MLGCNEYYSFESEGHARRNENEYTGRGQKCQEHKELSLYCFLKNTS